jgi:hypothetical protein
MLFWQRLIVWPAKSTSMGINSPMLSDFDTLLPDWLTFDASWTAQSLINVTAGSQQTLSYVEFLIQPKKAG